MARSHAPLLLAGLALLQACGGGSQDAGLALEPARPVTKVGEPLTLSAQALEALATEPEWEIQELHGGGFTRSRGFQITYVPPAAAGTYHLVARATRPDGSRLKVTVPVQVLPDPSVEPGTATVGQGGTLTFTARMKGLPRSTVSWSVEEADGGDISPEGVYRAPRRSGTFHVVATSTLDPSVTATATVRVD